MKTDSQLESTHPSNSKPWLWKPGQSGNPAGRPKGKTLKEWSKEYLARMTDEERDAWLEGVPKEIIWRMAEGNPTEDKNVSITVPRPILGGITQETEEIRRIPAKVRTIDNVRSSNEALNAPTSPDTASHEDSIVVEGKVVASGQLEANNEV